MRGSAATPGTSRRAKSPARRPEAAGRSAFSSKRCVVASPEGATAVTVAVERAGLAVHHALTFDPGRRVAAISDSTVARSSRPPSPSISMRGMPGFTTSPRFTRREATRPAKGARRAA